MGIKAKHLGIVNVYESNNNTAKVGDVYDWILKHQKDHESFNASKFPLIIMVTTLDKIKDFAKEFNLDFSTIDISRL